MVLRHLFGVKDEKEDLGVNNWVDNTTFHGVKDFVISDNILGKVFWFLIICGKQLRHVPREVRDWAKMP